MNTDLNIFPVKNHLILLLITAIFFFISHTNTDAQIKVTSALIKPDTTEAQYSSNDSLGVRGGKIKLISDVNAKSGSLAMLFSALLPGAGQVYAHRYYTIPFIWGLGAFFTSVAIKANSQYMDYRGKFSESVRLDTTAHSGDQNLLSARDFYHDQRDEYILYLGLTYFLNIIDANVGATLYDFDVSDELGGSAKIQFRVPLR
ncbi:MAG: DUF5683 domain-containing protein [Bacteroidota bacterium]